MRAILLPVSFACHLFACLAINDQTLLQQGVDVGNTGAIAETMGVDTHAAVEAESATSGRRRRRRRRRNPRPRPRPMPRPPRRFCAEPHLHIFNQGGVHHWGDGSVRGLMSKCTSGCYSQSTGCTGSCNYHSQLGNTSSPKYCGCECENDEHIYCVDWARLGYCASNSNHMAGTRTLCPGSCSVEIAHAKDLTARAAAAQSDTPANAVANPAREGIVAHYCVGASTSNAPIPTFVKKKFGNDINITFSLCWGYNYGTAVSAMATIPQWSITGTIIWPHNIFDGGCVFCSSNTPEGMVTICRDFTLKEFNIRVIPTFGSTAGTVVMKISFRVCLGLGVKKDGSKVDFIIQISGGLVFEAAWLGKSIGGQGLIVGTFTFGNLRLDPDTFMTYDTLTFDASLKGSLIYNNVKFANIEGYLTDEGQFVLVSLESIPPPKRNNGADCSDLAMAAWMCTQPMCSPDVGASLHCSGICAYRTGGSRRRRAWECCEDHSLWPNGQWCN